MSSSCTAEHHLLPTRRDGTPWFGRHRNRDAARHAGPLYATKAGFAAVDVLPLPDAFFRLLSPALNTPDGRGPPPSLSVRSPRGGAGRVQNQPEHLLEEQIEQPQRHARIMSDRRSPLVSDPGLDFCHPTLPPHPGALHRLNLRRGPPSQLRALPDRAVRLRWNPRTRAYAQRRTTEGMGKKEIIRRWPSPARGVAYSAHVIAVQLDAVNARSGQFGSTACSRSALPGSVE